MVGARGLPFLVDNRFDRTKLVCKYTGTFEQKYTIEKEIGAGVGGKAYIVVQKTTENRYVAKEAHEAEGVDELLAEFEWMKALSHPNIAKVIELVETKDIETGRDRHLVISEFAPGLDLFKYMSKALTNNTQLDEEWVAHVFEQAMSGVAYLHNQKIIHNDLKLDNILVMREFSADDPRRVPMVVVTDFGRSQRMSDSNIECGDPRYQSPEKWRAFEEDIIGTIDARTDVWSMGVTLFELLTSSLPFLNHPCTLTEFCENKEQYNKMHALVTDDEEVDLSKCSEASQEVQVLIKRMLCKSVEKRPVSGLVLEDPWFSIKGHTLSNKAAQGVKVVAMQREAHAILLQAMTAKLQREHYEAAAAAFSRFDSTNTGEINRPDFKEAFRHLFQGQNDDQTLDVLADKVFESVDNDKSGTLHFNEYLVATFDWGSLKPDVLEKNLKDVFNVIDEDQNGIISQEELANFLKGALLAEQIRITFEIIDEDKDGKVTLPELKKFLFEPMKNEDLEKYIQNLDSAGVRLCERVEPESIGALGCWTMAYFFGCGFKGCLACTAGALFAMARLKRAPETRHLFDESRKAPT